MSGPRDGAKSRKAAYHPPELRKRGGLSRVTRGEVIRVTDARTAF